MWTALMEGELANTLELTDGGGGNLMLLVCLNGEIKERERRRNLGDLNATEEATIAELLHCNENSLQTTRNKLVICRFQ